MSKQRTYRKLFGVLLSLGFEENRLNGNDGPRTFVHVATDTWLLFGRLTNVEVTSADLLSTEVHLHGKGITDQPLESLLSDSLVTK